jgi:hypothetical protein
VFKIDNVRFEYQQIGYDKNENLVIGRYNKLDKIFFDETTQEININFI